MIFHVFPKTWDDSPSNLNLTHATLGGVTKYLTFCGMILQVIGWWNTEDSLRAKHNVQVLAQQSEAWIFFRLGVGLFQVVVFREGRDEWNKNLEPPI